MDVLPSLKRGKGNCYNYNLFKPKTNKIRIVVCYVFVIKRHFFKIPVEHYVTGKCFNAWR